MAMSPPQSAKELSPMANEETAKSKDFIVVGGRRRWFSVLDRDERFSELQQRVMQERDLSIPERPPEIS
tara:strand:+ start:375 stop:581 length:207 start_codon:yes stop_codon:yes gene_type:complete